MQRLSAEKEHIYVGKSTAIADQEKMLDQTNKQANKDEEKVADKLHKAKSHAHKKQQQRNKQTKIQTSKQTSKQVNKQTNLYLNAKMKIAFLVFKQVQQLSGSVSVFSCSLAVATKVAQWVLWELPPCRLISKYTFPSFI